MRKIPDFGTTAKMKPALILMLVLAAYVAPELKAQAADSVTLLLEEYAYNMLYVEGEDALKSQLEILLQKATQLHTVQPGPATLYLLARITYGYSTTQGVFGMSRSLRTTKNYLEQSLAVDEFAMRGKSKALLGYLYAGLPPWPVSFGDKTKGRKLLGEAMELDPMDMSTNYFFAAIYLREKDYLSARTQLRKAKALADNTSATPMLQNLLLREIDSNLAALDKRLP